MMTFLSETGMRAGKRPAQTAALREKKPVKEIREGNELCFGSTQILTGARMVCLLRVFLS